MPPYGRDEQVQALHMLNVLERAKALIAAIASSGGIAKADLSQEGIRDALRSLFDETSKLQVYESRAAARGTLSKLDDEGLALAIKGVRDGRILTAGEQDVRDATPEQIAEAFSLDDVEPVKAPEPGKPEDAFDL
jgi:hypothetical protein